MRSTGSVEGFRRSFSGCDFRFASRFRRFGRSLFISRDNGDIVIG